jgi:hypothetical protein
LLFHESPDLTITSAPNANSIACAPRAADFHRNSRPRNRSAVTGDNPLGFTGGVKLD